MYRSVIDDDDAAGRDLLGTPLEYGPLETLEGEDGEGGHAAEMEMYTPYSSLPNV